MAISVVTRSYKSSELRSLISNLNLNLEIEFEIIAVCNVNDHDIPNSKLIIENSNRFRARITGIRNAQFDKILLLDSDQIVEKGLLRELDNRKEDMIIIAESSINNSLSSRFLNDTRLRSEKYAKKNTSPYIPVIPRFYKKKSLLNALNKLPPNIDEILSHEDSILYHEVFKDSRNIGFSERHIYNNDPNLLVLMHKTYLYGAYKKKIKSLEIPEDISILINKLNLNTFNIKELGVSRWYALQIARAFVYFLGSVLG